MLSKSTLVNIISNENIPSLDGTTTTEETIVSPVDSPSASQTVTPEVVISTEPTAEPAAPEVVADIAAAAAAAPETDVPVDIEMAVNTQNPTEMMGQATQESGVCQSRADELLAMQHALECYNKLIRQTGLEGISKEGAAFMQVGLEIIQRSLGTNVTVSSESYGDIDPRSNRVKAVVSAEGIKELADKTYKAFVEAIKKLIELMRKGWEHLLDAGMAQEGKIDELLDRLKNVKSTAVGQEIMIHRPGMLFADGEEVYPELKPLFGLAHFALVAYPKSMEDYYSKVGTYIKSLNDYELSEEEIRENLDSVAKPLHDLAKDPSSRALFNGNYAVDISENELSFGIKETDGKEPPSEFELPVAPPIKLRKLLGEIRQINTILKDYRPANERVIKAAEKLVGVSEKLENADGIARTILSVVKDAAPRNREIAQYIAKVTKTYLVIIERQIERHEAATNVK